MASWLAYFLSWSHWLWTKTHFTTPDGLRQHVAKTREDPPDHRPPLSFHSRFIVEERRVDGGYPVYDISPKSEKPSRVRILYVHGGSFVFEISSNHWTLVALLVERLHARITVPIYPLAPEKKLNDQLAMLQPIYDDMMVASSGDDTPVIAAGDSAGSCLILALTQEALQEGKSVAAGLMLITPVVDVTLRNEESHKLSPRDPSLDIVGLDESIQLARGDRSVYDPRASPLLGEVDRLPPMMVLTAENDLLGPDARLFVDKARAAGREVTHVEGKGMMHVWPLELPHHDGKEAIDRMVHWIEGFKE
ncbi:hypothetical protein E4U23_004327 [Claviceps purpurea]|nr:hypothetical protein E4U23_004327 [Claviceps purpurea]